MTVQPATTASNNRPPAPFTATRRFGYGAAAIALLVVVGWFGRSWWQPDPSLLAFQQANGRIEATEVAIASKIAGRISDILVNEGDFVAAGQLLAKIDPAAHQAALEQAKAQLRQVDTQIANAESLVQQRQGERHALEALLLQRRSEADGASSRARRTAALVKTGAVSAQSAEDQQTAVKTANAAIASAEAQLEANQAAIHAAQTQVLAAKASQEAAAAGVQRLEVELKETELFAPKAGRIQYRVVQPGEVIAAGGRVLNLLDLTDVYMTFFLPTRYAGQLTLQSEARIVVDALPQWSIPASISYIADVAQFTPKTVETASEREKMMFRVKARIPAELLQKHIQQVKTGLPGVVWVRLDASHSWPAELPPLVQ